MTGKILYTLLREHATDDEGQDMEPLTPNHLLLLHSESPMPPGLFRREDQLSQRRWGQMQYLADIFQKIWSKEYLPLLQDRQKWLRPRRNLAIGDVVLVSVEYSHHNSWPLGKIVEVLLVTVKKAVLKRRIEQHCLLAEGDDSQ